MRDGIYYQIPGTLFHAPCVARTSPKLGGSVSKGHVCSSYLRISTRCRPDRLTYSAAIGDIRSTRGAVIIRSRSGQEISWNQIFDVAEAAPGQWTHVSVVLREDHGWLHEPLGKDVTIAEMKDILDNANDLLIRGDLRVFGRSGGGQEVVYLQDVRLLAKA